MYIHANYFVKITYDKNNKENILLNCKTLTAKLVNFKIEADASNY